MTLGFSPDAAAFVLLVGVMSAAGAGVAIVVGGATAPVYGLLAMAGYMLVVGAWLTFVAVEAVSA